MNWKHSVKVLSGKGLLLLSLSAMVIGSSAQESLAQKVKKTSKAGVGVYEIALNPVDGYLYVSSIGTMQSPNGGIMKIDPKSLKIVDSIMMADQQPFGIALNAKTQIAYTSNTISNSVSAIDLKMGKVIATIKNGKEKSHTREIIIDEEKNLVYVSDVGDESTIWVIDGNKNEFLYEIGNIGKNVTGMVLSEAKDKIYATVLGDNSIAVIDLASKSVAKSFPSGGEGPINIASDGYRLFVANRKSHNLTVLDLDGKLITSIPTGDGALGIDYDAKTNRIYAANRGSGTATIIDGKTYKVIKDLPTGTHPNNVKVGKDGAVYVLNKAKGGKKGDTAAPPPDPNGDTITLIN